MYSVKEVAQMQGCSETIIYRHIRKHKSELGDNVQKANGRTWLTDEAVEFLRNLMTKDPIVVSDNSEEIEKWRLKYEGVLEEFNRYMAHVTPVLEKAHNQIALAEQSEVNKKKAEELEARVSVLSEENEEQGKQLQEVAEELKSKDERIQELENRNLIQRIFNKR